MLAGGAIEEVKKLATRQLDPSLPAMKAHGVPWLIRHLGGEIALAEATEGGKRDTRRYTKRQATWFRNQLPGFRMGYAAGRTRHRHLGTRMNRSYKVMITSTTISATMATSSRRAR